MVKSPLTNVLPGRPFQTVIHRRQAAVRPAAGPYEPVRKKELVRRQAGTCLSLLYPGGNPGGSELRPWQGSETSGGVEQRKTGLT